MLKGLLVTVTVHTVHTGWKLSDSYFKECQSNLKYCKNNVKNMMEIFARRFVSCIRTLFAPICNLFCDARASARTVRHDLLTEPVSTALRAGGWKHAFCFISELQQRDNNISGTSF